MLNTQVKICGITSARDARLSVSLGADYIGLIFAASQRRVDPDAAMTIRDSVPDARLVGVFMDESIDTVVDISRQCRLDMIQLHGDESPEYCDELIDRIGLPVIKSINYSQLDNIERVGDYTRTSYFLFDLDKGTDPGTVNGTRERLWEEAAALRSKGYRIFLAGGLDCSNVAQAIERVVPHAIDIAGGVEQEPGIKDSAALERLFREVKG